MPFQLEGRARAIANMSIGQITLDPIKFNVTSGLNGLQGLKSLVSIDSVDVLGGSTEAIHLGIGGESQETAGPTWGADCTGYSEYLQPVEPAVGYWRPQYVF